MAEFFDKKEDVMDIQLTQYGKYLLSMGKFKPIYYAFYDQDITYDGQYGPGKESQNQAQNRIKHLTSRLKTQSIFAGVETHVTNLNKQVVNDDLGIEDPKQQPLEDKFDGLSMPIGTCDLNAESTPSWEIKFLKSPLSSSVEFFSASIHQILQIPQLETHYVLNTFSNPGASPEDDLDEPIVIGQDLPEELTDLRSGEFFDGSFYELSQEYVFLDVLENNGIKGRENFEVEVFKVETYKDKFGNQKEDLRQLYFASPPEGYNLKSISYEDIYNNPNYVEYYFDLDFDQEIREEILCDVKFVNHIKDLRTDIELEFQCGDEPTEEVIYKPSDDDTEVC